MSAKIEKKLETSKFFAKKLVFLSKYMYLCHKIHIQN